MVRLSNDAGSVARLKLSQNVVVTALLGILLLVAVIHTLPPSRMTIVTGPVGGSYYNDALQYQADLAQQGLRLRIVTIEDTADMARYVQMHQNEVDFGFSATSLDPKLYPDIRSLGSVQLQPLFVFVSKALGHPTTLEALIGQRIVMPTFHSESAAAALKLLALYGINSRNTTIAFLPLRDAVVGLQNRQYDAGFFLLAPQNPFVVSLVGNRNFELLSLGNDLAVSRLLPDFQAVTLPRGLYDVERYNPADDVAMLAANVNLIVRKGVPHALLYAMMETLDHVHRPASLLNDSGRFPNLDNLAAPPDGIATDYQKLGMPWIYRNLPRWLAAPIDSYFVIGVLLLIAIRLWTSLNSIAQLTDAVVVYYLLNALSRLEERVNAGQRLSKHHLGLLKFAERVISRTDRRQRGTDILSRIHAKHDPRAAGEQLELQFRDNPSP